MLLIVLLIIGCEPINDILGVLNTKIRYKCSIYGYAKKTTMDDEDLSYEDSLTVLLSTYINGDNVSNATDNCENNYGNIEGDKSLGMFDSCYCEK